MALLIKRYRLSAPVHIGDVVKSDIGLMYVCTRYDSEWIRLDNVDSLGINPSTLYTDIIFYWRMPHYPPVPRLSGHWI